MNIMETGRQTASMTAWEAIPAPEQVEIIIRAAKRAVYIAGAYGVVLTVDEIMGATWEGTVKRLNAGRLDKANAKQIAKGKQLLTIAQITYRAAHTAAELDRYDYNRHKTEPLGRWTDVDVADMEDEIINRLVIEDCISHRDSIDKTIAELTIIGHTQRQTGEAVGMSSPAVYKRLTRIRKELKKAIA